MKLHPCIESLRIGDILSYKVNSTEVIDFLAVNSASNKKLALVGMSSYWAGVSYNVETFIERQRIVKILRANWQRPISDSRKDRETFP